MPLARLPFTFLLVLGIVSAFLCWSPQIVLVMNPDMQADDALVVAVELQPPSQ